MNCRIIAATENDLKAINQLLRLSKSHWGYDENFIKRFMQDFSVDAERLKKTTTCLFLADDKLAGFFGLSVNEEGEFELDNFFLHPDFLGKGLGYKLWEATCQTAKEMGATEFVIWSDPNAEGFYLKMGCEKIGVRQSSLMPDRFPPVLKYKL